MLIFSMLTLNAKIVEYSYCQVAVNIQRLLFFFFLSGLFKFDEVWHEDHLQNITVNIAKACEELKIL